MLLTHRFTISIIFLAALLALSGVFSELFWISLALNIALLLLLVVDVLYTPSPSLISVTRHCDEKLSLGARNIVQLHFRNRSNLVITIEVRDEAPHLFDVSDEAISFKLSSDSETQISYSVTPRRRGNYEFGNINIRYLSALRLFKRQTKIAQNMKVKVYPNLLELKKYIILARRGRFAETGLRHSKMYGEGTEFEFLREYLPDDDYRRINWKASARIARPISEEYEHERSQNITIMLDCGRMMTADINDMSKLDYTINSALMLGYVSSIKGDNIGLIAFSDEIEAYIPPQRGKQQLYRIIEALYDISPKMCQPDYEKAFTLMESKLRKRSLVVVFTDLIDVEISKTLISYLPLLRPHHLALCVTLKDSDLINMADAVPDAVENVYQKAVAGELLMEQQNTLNKLHESGVLVLSAAPENLSIATLNRYLELKGRNMI